MRSLLVSIVPLLLIGSRAPAQTLEGAIDMHAHCDPDGTRRSIDAIDLARLARSRGMRALVLKNHYEPTASLAWIVRREVPGIEIFGGISLDLTVGGVNPAAVEWMTKVKGGYGRVIWLPTFDSEAQVKLTHQQRPFARVSKEGKVVPEVVQVMAIAAKNNLVLETGHSSPAECMLLIEEAKRQGVDVEYAFCSDYHVNWMHAAFITASALQRGNVDEVYRALDWFNGGSYCAGQAVRSGYAGARMDLAMDFVTAQKWPDDKVALVKANMDKVKFKFSNPNFWISGLPDDMKTHEAEAERFRNA